MANSKSILIVLLAIFLTACGTLGGFDKRNFPVSKLELAKAFDSILSKYPQYRVPSKWKQFDDWQQRGYGFMDSRIFYFNSNPEEMYYVAFLKDLANDSNSHTSSIAIRAINKGSSVWVLESSTSVSDKKRIQKRFDEDILKKVQIYIDTTDRPE